MLVTIQPNANASTGQFVASATQIHLQPGVAQRFRLKNGITWF